MKFCTFTCAARTGAGLIRGKEVVDLGLAYFQAFKRPFKFNDLGDFLQQGGLERLAKLDFATLKHDPKIFVPLQAATLRAPVTRPPKLTCLGLNYRAHAAEQNKPLPEQPLLFAKAANVVIGPDEPVVIPRQSQQIDYEAELAVVIKDACADLSPLEAMDHVFGFTAMNDVTARDIQHGDKQWYRGKSFATFAPLGPVVVTPDELAHDKLAISLTLNGARLQEGNTADMIFRVPDVLAYVSSVFPLEAGDVISTGTPAGVGVFRTPPVFLKDGDVMEVTIEGIGTLRNRVTARREEL